MFSSEPTLLCISGFPHHLFSVGFIGIYFIIYLLDLKIQLGLSFRRLFVLLAYVGLAYASFTKPYTLILDISVGSLTLKYF
jgi:hypothetical protein